MEDEAGDSPKGPRPLQPPALLGNLISYRGFKELAFVASSSDIVYAIDADLGKIFWQKHLEYASLDPPVATSTWACPGGLTAMPGMPPPAARGGAPPAASPGPAPARGPFAPFGVASVYAISAMGGCIGSTPPRVTTSHSPWECCPRMRGFRDLTIDRNVIYTVTAQECNGVPNAVWAVDLTAEPPKAASFPLKGADALGLGGPRNWNRWDGVRTDQRPVARLEWEGSGVEAHLRGAGGSKKDPDLNAVSPLVIPYKDGELIVTLGRDSRLHLLSADAPEKSLYDSPPIASGSGGVWGGMSTWEVIEGPRWILVPVWGAVNPELKVPGTNGPASSGSILAFRLDEKDGSPVLTPVWASRDMSTPEPPAIGGGVVFALSSGEFTRQAGRAGEIEERAKSGTRATLYALDAATGKELYSSRAQIAGPAALTGLTLANGRVYFAGMDGTVYCFGMYLEH